MLFGAGDHRTRTEQRPPPPSLAAGARLQLGAIALARLTHAAGLSSTGDAALPWPERYDIPAATTAAIATAPARGGRVIAIGTTVVRALEASGGESGPGVATLRIAIAPARVARRRCCG